MNLRSGWDKRVYGEKREKNSAMGNFKIGGIGSVKSIFFRFLWNDSV